MQGCIMAVMALKYLFCIIKGPEVQYHLLIIGKHSILRFISIRHNNYTSIIGFQISKNWIFIFFSFQPTHENVEDHNIRRKSHSTPATLFWLQSNFHLSEGVCIPRCEVYSYYVDYCNRGLYHPVNAASFGKVS